MIIFIFFLSILIIIGGIIYIRYDPFGFGPHLHIITPAVIISVVLALLIGTAWPAYYFGTRSFGEELKAAKMTLEICRKNDMHKIELTAIMHKMVDYNAELKVIKYWNDTIFDPFFPDDVANIEFIK